MQMIEYTSATHMAATYDRCTKRIVKLLEEVETETKQLVSAFEGNTYGFDIDLYYHGSREDNNEPCRCRRDTAARCRTPLTRPDRSGAAKHLTSNSAAARTVTCIWSSSDRICSTSSTRLLAAIVWRRRPSLPTIATISCGRETGSPGLRIFRPSLAGRGLTATVCVAAPRTGTVCPRGISMTAFWQAELHRGADVYDADFPRRASSAEALRDAEERLGELTENVWDNGDVEGVACNGRTATAVRRWTLNEFAKWAMPSVAGLDADAIDCTLGYAQFPHWFAARNQ